MRRLTAEPGPLDDGQQIELALNGLPAGEYRLELTAAHDGVASTQALDLRIVP